MLLHLKLNKSIHKNLGGIKIIKISLFNKTRKNTRFISIFKVKFIPQETIKKSNSFFHMLIFLLGNKILDFFKKLTKHKKWVMNKNFYIITNFRIIWKIPFSLKIKFLICNFLQFRFMQLVNHRRL